MKKPMLPLMIVISILAYSIAAFAYMHNNFIGKDIFGMLCARLERIENKIDVLLEDGRQ